MIKYFVPEAFLEASVDLIVKTPVKGGDGRPEAPRALFGDDLFGFDDGFFVLFDCSDGGSTASSGIFGATSAPLLVFFDDVGPYHSVARPK